MRKFYPHKHFRGIMEVLIGGTMSEPTPPDKIVFRSDMQTASQKPADYFAEQNKQRAEKKAKQKKQVKLALWIGGTLVIILLAGLIAWLAVLMSQTSSSDNAGITLGSGSIEEIDTLRDLADDVFDASASVGTDGEFTISGNIEAASQLFVSTLNNAENKKYADQIRLSAMSFYYYNGYYDELVKYAEEVNPENLSYDQKIMFYNLASLGYSSIGNSVKSDEYMNMALTLNVLGE